VRYDLFLDCENIGDASNLAAASLTRKSPNKSSISLLYPELKGQIFRVCFSGDRVYEAINKVEISLEGFEFCGLIVVRKLNAGKKQGGDLETEA
jgi:hypothetical protein